MKRLIYIIFFFCAAGANAQNYFIDFAGTGASASVGTVKVENLTAGTSLTLNGTDILHLVAITTGVTSVENKQSGELKIYPNPMKYNAVLQFSPPVEGTAMISVIDISGRILLQSQYFLENSQQEFRLTELKSGFYLININGSSYQISGKLVCNGTPDGKLSIERISVNQKTVSQTIKKVTRELLSTVDMNYTSGDRLKFTGTSGIYSTVFMDVPTSDKTITFNFIDCTDGDNNNYPTVKIGNQIWMAENLKTSKYSNGDLIGTTNPPTMNIGGENTPKYQWVYDGNDSNANIYGRLYTWYVVTDIRNVCPSGWQIPSDEDLKTLTTYLGGENYSGNKLKETGSTHWSSTNIGVTNEVGFSALPGGRRLYSGLFEQIKIFGIWSSYSEDKYGSAITRYMASNTSQMILYQDDERNGQSIRCIKSEEEVLPILSTTELTSITGSTASSGGNISNDGGGFVNARGVCWSTSQNPTISDNHTTDKFGVGIYTSNITGLSGTTTYYVRSFATNIIGTSYGNEVSCTTLELHLPTLTTSPILNILSESANGGGVVTADGNGPVTERGLCWSTSPNPTIENNKKTNGNGTGSFTCSLNALTGLTTYFVRAYASNSLGTSYGNEISFTTGPPTLPVLNTVGVSHLSQTAANCGGMITNDGGAPITFRGVCWSTNQNPTITDNKTSDGVGTGIFVSSIAELIPNTIYYVRAYAVNSVGAAYGNEIFFATRGSGSIEDIDGNIYNTVRIGTQVWMAENLKTTRYRNGDFISTTNPATFDLSGESSPEYQWPYEGIENNASIFGRLYTWYTVKDNRGICPTGWHVPSDNEWTILNNYLIKNGYAYEGSGTDISKSMASTSGWNPYGGAGTIGWDQLSNNSSGFTALPAGERISTGDFGNIGYDATWWSASVYSTNTTYADYTGLGSTSTDLLKSFTSKKNGFSVRCLSPDQVMPTIITTPITGIGMNSATGGGNITSDGGDLISISGICWSTSHNPTTTDSHTSTSSGTDIFTLNLTGLTDNTTYYVRAYATNSIGMAYGNEVEFTTNTCLLSTLSTTVITMIAPNSATSGGNITANGGCSVSNSGICWSILPNPTINDSHTTSTTGSGSFSGNLTGLIGGTTYYVRAYATNRSGTGYGNEISFATSPLTIITNPITSITQTGAKSGGNITDDGGSVITARGVCWSTAENPTIADSFTSDGAGDGIFVSNLAGLTPNTGYHLRAFATNTYGTAYGAQVNFTTKYSGDNTVTDIEGNVYNIVIIGLQVWMAENLKTTKYNDGTSIPTFTDNWEQNTSGIAAYCDFNNTPAYSEIYGRLYNWKVVDPNNPHKICPTGWHAPSDAEWTILTTYLGGENVSGGKLKETGTTHWVSPNEGATNETGFTALPGGNCRFEGSFQSMGSSAYWWSTTYVSAGEAWYRRIYNNATVVERNSFMDQCAYSVRCLKDN